MAKTITQMRIEAGLPRCTVSAKRLATDNPRLAKRWASFIAKNETAIKAAIVGALVK